MWNGKNQEWTETLQKIVGNSKDLKSKTFKKITHTKTRHTEIKNRDKIYVLWVKIIMGHHSTPDIKTVENLRPSANSKISNWKFLDSWMNQCDIRSRIKSYSIYNESEQAIKELCWPTKQNKKIKTHASTKCMSGDFGKLFLNYARSKTRASAWNDLVRNSHDFVV